MRRWELDGIQGQLANRSEAPACGQVKHRLPLLIREVVLFEIPAKQTRFNNTISVRRRRKLTWDRSRRGALRSLRVRRPRVI